MKRKINSNKFSVLFVLFYFVTFAFGAIKEANGQVVLAESLPLPPAMILPMEPQWESVVETEVTTTEELQEIIEAAGVIPTKIRLKKNINRQANTGATGHHVLKVSENQRILLAGIGVEKVTIDVIFAPDVTRGVLFVEEKGTLYLENIVLTGGNRVNKAGGGGGVLIGLGQGSAGEALLVMKHDTEITGNQAGLGGGVYVSPNSQFYMLGGAITNNESKVRGGGVYTYPGGEFYLENGEISTNFGGNQGGNGVYIDGTPDTKSLFTMKAGLITQNTRPAKVGGGVYLNNAIFNMTGGEISYHNGNGRGGGVAVTDSIFNLWGGQIKNNSNYYGGAVTVVGSLKEKNLASADVSMFNMYGGTIGGNSEEEANRGAYPGVMIGNAGWGNQGGTFNMYGGKISYNISDGDGKHGGGLFVTNFGQASILGESEISHNRLTDKGLGGGVGVYYGALVIDEQTLIADNYAGYGGGIYADNADVTFANGLVNANTAEINGGGVYLSPKTNFYLKKGTISHNVSSGNGGGIYLVKAGTLYLEGGELVNNRATQNGGAIFNNSSPDFSNVFLPENSTVAFSKNRASKVMLNGILPTIGDWGGTISSTSIDGMQFKGRIQSKIDEFLASGGMLEKLLVFNNHDINTKATDNFYTVIFDSNGGSNVPSQLVSDDGSGVVEEPDTPEKADYHFAGWFKDKDMKTLYNFNEVVTSDMILYGKWAPIIEGTVVTKYQDETGKEIAVPNSTIGEVGTAYTTVEKKIAGYTLKTLPINASGEYLEGTTEVIYIYSEAKDSIPSLEGKVVTKYVNEAGQEIATRNHLTGEVGKAYTTEEKIISGYKIKSVPANATGKYQEGTIEVSYVYSEQGKVQPIIEGTVVTIYQDETGQEIAARNRITGEVGTGYETEEKIIPGFKINDVPANATGNYVEGTLEVIYVYQKNSKATPIVEGTVVTIYQDETGQEIATRNQTTGEVGRAYKTKAKIISGYRLKKEPTNKTGNYTEGRIEVIYIYQVKKDNQTINTGETKNPKLTKPIPNTQQNKSTDRARKNNLPQTGIKKELGITILGLMIVVIFSYALNKRKTKLG